MVVSFYTLLTFYKKKFKKYRNFDLFWKRSKLLMNSIFLKKKFLKLLIFSFMLYSIDNRSKLYTFVMYLACDYNLCAELYRHFQVYKCALAYLWMPWQQACSLLLFFCLRLSFVVFSGIAILCDIDLNYLVRIILPNPNTM